MSQTVRDTTLGRSRVVSGTVSPAHGGSVRLVVKRNGSIIERKSATLNDSRYRFGYKPTRPGRYTFYAIFPKDADHLGNRSVERGFRVVR